MKALRVAVLTAVLVLTGCAGGDDAATRRGATHDANEGTDAAFVQAAVDSTELPVSRDELIAVLRTAELEPVVFPNLPDVPGSTQRALSALPEEPLSCFFLGVDGEGMMAFEFSTTEIAKLMSDYQEGITYRNWYLDGIITYELDREMRKALKG